MELRPISATEAKVINAAVFVTSAASGVLSEDPALFYRNMGWIYVQLLAFAWGGGAIVQAFAMLVGTRIQTKKSFTAAMIAREAFESAICFVVVAAFGAWPVTRAQLGHEIAFGELKESPAFYFLKAFAFVLLADAYNYWKHRMLHHRILWQFHKSHHQFYTPSAAAGFAISPVEALLTFWPLLMFCIPGLNLYYPWHAPILFFFASLNLFLHCGYRIPILDDSLAFFYINRASWHDKHHSATIVRFGEILSLWDELLGTDRLRKKE